MKNINTHGRTMTDLEEATKRINEDPGCGWIQVGYDRATGEIHTQWVEKDHWVQWHDPDIINIPWSYIYHCHNSLAKSISSQTLADAIDLVVSQEEEYEK